MSLRGALPTALVLVLTGCGGAAATAPTTPDTREDPCVALGQRRDAADEALAACRADVPAWRHQAVFDEATRSVQAVAVAAGRGPVPPEDAQHAADAVWELLDAVSPELTNHLSLDRAENAAEALLRDRQGDAARAAITEASAALEEIRATLVPAEDPCASQESSAADANAAAADCH